MKKLTFLHTSPVHIATFNALLAEQNAAVVVEHVVVESLLDRARADGLTDDLRQDVEAVVLTAVSHHANLVLCTCSTIGDLAEAASKRTHIPILRLDRPMAEKAVALGSRIIIAAALASTLQPTAHLIRDAARQVGKQVKIIEWLCESAWEKFEAGDNDAYWETIAASLETAVSHGDVIVLAQGSMAGAAPRCAHLPIPILSSPALGLAAALAQMMAAS